MRSELSASSLPALIHLGITFSLLFVICRQLVSFSEWGSYRYIYFIGGIDTGIVYVYYHPKCQTINNTQKPAG